MSRVLEIVLCLSLDAWQVKSEAGPVASRATSAPNSSVRGASVRRCGCGAATSA